jgi:quinol monooxygenase YgiN
MTKLGEISEITSKPGKRLEVLEVLAETVDDIKATEPGTELAVFQSDTDDDVTVWIYVLFSDLASRDIHRTKAAQRDSFRERLRPLVEGPTKQRVMNVEFGKLP